MIKFQGAYGSSTGAMLKMQTAFFDGVTPRAATDAIGDAVARIVQHAVAVFGDAADPEQLIAEVYSRANDVYPTLPAVTSQDQAQAVRRNDSPDTEPTLREFPSGDDEQVLTCGLSMRVNGYEVMCQRAATEPTPFDAISVAAAGLLGAIVAHGLTSSAAPANILACEDMALECFKETWSISMPVGKIQRTAAVVAARDRRIHKFVFGELDEEN